MLPPIGRPNLLWIYAEDMYPDLSCYGTPAVQTPHLDRFASQGALFRNAHVTCPVCSSSRSGIITGMYQTSFGAHQHRSCRNTPLPEGIRLITDYFRDAGYFTCNSSGPPQYRRGKTDFNFKEEHPFDGIDWSDRAEGQPFYAQINIPDTHRAFVRDPERPIDPAAVEVPPYYPDHPMVRKDWAMWLETVQVLDRKFGLIMDRLDEEGLSDNTIVFFISDHGRGHIRDKQFLYDGGIRIPCIVRWPGRIEPGQVLDDLVSGIDFAPTSLALAGLPVPKQMEGQVFLGPDAQKRDFIISCRDRCDGTDDRIRCVRTRDLKYIRNYHPDRPYMQFNAYKKLQYPLWTLVKVLHERGRLTPEQQLFVQDTRPPEELYDLSNDPHEVHNLTGEPQWATRKEQLSAILDHWIQETGDRGEVPEDPAECARQDADMAESWRKQMEARGLASDISDEDYLVWWEEWFQKKF